MVVGERKAPLVRPRGEPISYWLQQANVQERWVDNATPSCMELWWKPPKKISGGPRLGGRPHLARKAVLHGDGDGRRGMFVVGSVTVRCVPTGITLRTLSPASPIVPWSLCKDW